MAKRANVFTIPAGEAFAEALARGVIAQTGAGAAPLELAATTIYVPTRRAVRTLSDAFAAQLGGAALLPDIRPLGNVEEDDFLFDPQGEDLALAPPIAPVRRVLLLATLIAQWERSKTGQEIAFVRAAALARSLAGFLDDMQTEGVALSALQSLTPEGLAEHWAEAREFLSLLVTHWPDILAEEGALDRAAHRNAALRALAQRLAAHPPQAPVIAAGSTGSIPATAGLLGVIATLPQGAVVLPALDTTLDEKSWAGADEGHPQFGMKQLLMRMGLAREDVKLWPGAKPAGIREELLSETLRPAPTTDAWRALVEKRAPQMAAAFDGLTLIEAADPAEEARAIALILREVLESETRTAALVTPDRALARRVAAEMERFEIAIDDSAGRPLAHTPSGAFLCLIAEAAESKFAPVPLLALLKHPLAAGGTARGHHLHMVRALDLCLRGPAPDAGADGIRRAITRQTGDRSAPCDPAVAPWFERIAATLQPLTNILNGPARLGDAVAAHLAAAEVLAADDKQGGADRLWRGDAGLTAREFLAQMGEAAARLLPMVPGSYAQLFRQFALERSVRPRFGQHPRLFILGPLEARLQRHDVMVLGGLNEGTWPAHAAIDPWLSRPMRRQLQLESPERAIGLAAHDFATLAAGPRVYLTRSRKADGAPTVASRWLQRLLQLARGLNCEEKLTAGTDYTGIAQHLLQPKNVTRIEKPRPTPAVALRPRKLSVTEIETWLRDPYAIYARHILKLKPLDPLEAPFGPRERGTLIHRALEKFLIACPGALPADAEKRLIEIADAVFAEFAIPKSILAIWRPRFLRAAQWFVASERGREAAIVKRHLEKRGEMTIPAPGGDFVLHGRADRIDELPGGEGAVIDYKTGRPPTNRQVETLLAPQLPLEAAMLAGGKFADIAALTPVDLIYIQLGGGNPPGKIITIGDAGALTNRAMDYLSTRIAQFDDAVHPYPPRVIPVSTKADGDYDHLARVREWQLSVSEEDEA
ncbi:MAG: double-strand break repair protein AddB [Alphaproteobacteria bacterium]|nr:double-strand break repair protein AddB [Alphaproteobacteria bacterium]